MKLLVTGGAGFIGSNFIKYLLKKHSNITVYNLDKLTYAGNQDNLIELDKEPRYIFIKGDICNQKMVNRIAGQVDAIVNFAAETHVDRSILDPESFINTNIKGTYTLLEAVKKYKVKRFVQISTDEVYGSILSGSFTEKSLLNPSSPYSASKASADMLINSYFVTYKIPVMIARPSNNFGPYQYPEKFIPLFLTNAMENKICPLYGDGKNVRDWLYVLDNCEAIDLVLNKGKEGQVYNVSSGNTISNIRLAEIIVRSTGKSKMLIKKVTDRRGHDRRYSLDSTKIRKELSWEPKSDFDDVLAETLCWYRGNRWWWEKIKNRETSKRWGQSSRM
jgi:dTDP-glucose 4,6-dehydratase